MGLFYRLSLVNEMRRSQYFETVYLPYHLILSAGHFRLCFLPWSSPCSLPPQGLSVPDLLAHWLPGRFDTRLEGRKRQRRQRSIPLSHMASLASGCFSSMAPALARQTGSTSHLMGSGHATSSHCPLALGEQWLPAFDHCWAASSFLSWILLCPIISTTKSLG